MGGLTVELPLTPLDFLERARRLYPRRVGVIDGDIRRTYAEFADRADRLARALRDEVGIAPGDRVAWLCGNTAELLEGLGVATHHVPPPDPDPYPSAREEGLQLGNQRVGVTLEHIGALRVEVVFASPERQELVGLEVAEGTTVAQAIEQSQLAEKFPEHDLARCAVGVWGQVVGRDRRLRDGDRVEIYRPLRMDPQEARRELAAKGRSMGKRRS